MKQCRLCTSYIALLFLAVCFNSDSRGIFVSGDDGDLRTVHVSDNTSENGSAPVVGVQDAPLEPSVDAETLMPEKNGENTESYHQQIFTEVASQNSGIPNEIVNNGAPVVLTLSDTATTELQQRADMTTSPPTVSPGGNNRSESTSETEADTGSPPPTIDRNATAEERPEDMPSFSEWAQKRLEEAERKEQVNSSVQGDKAQTASNGKQGSGAKLRWKNYASLDCGAKVIASNPEAVSPWAVLSPSKDEYKLNTCTSRIWFVVELCEAIQAKKIDLANYELFSSSPRDFAVTVADRFPTREWTTVGQFTALDERDVQSFDLEPRMFGKYIRVEIKSHYGAEHFCPISLFRVYGTSVFEVLQKDDPAHDDARTDEDDDDDETEEVGDSPKNLFSSATDAVISMVKKAAEVLGNKQNKTRNSSGNDTQRYTPLVHACTTPSHLVVCNGCSDTLFGRVFELLSCNSAYIRNLIAVPFIGAALRNSDVCESYGLDLRDKTANKSTYGCAECVRSFFPDRFLAAMCNTVAILDNKVVLNISQQFNNVTKNASAGDEMIVDVSTTKPQNKIEMLTKEVELQEDETIKPTEPLVLDETETKTTTISSDPSITSQIKPTKASDVDVNHLTDTSTVSASMENEMVPPNQSEQQVAPSDVPEVPEHSPSESSASPDMIASSPVESTVGVVQDDHMDNLLSEFSGETHVNSVNPTAATPPNAQKESVFLRLSNRIKALERNMSLSSQYLEELSRRYKKQVEEMQKLLERTISTLTEESRKKDERNKELEDRLDNLTKSVEMLLAERKGWPSFLWPLLVCAVALGIALALRRGEVSEVTRNAVRMERRKSIDVVGHNPPVVKKKRRPSDQALKIYRSISSGENERKLKERKKRKRTKPLKRSGSMENLNGDWIDDRNQRIEEVPFALDEMEHSTLEDLPVPSDLGKIDVPDFVQTAASARLSRSSQNTESEEKMMKGKKSKSLDESNNKIVIQAFNGNGTANSSSDETPKKERKGFKKLLKKVF